MKAIHKEEQGFTLGELLVVIAIMTILVGVAVGSFTGLIGSGSDEAKVYELEAVQVAIEAYMGVNAAGTVSAQAVPAEVTSGDFFAQYMRRLPTKYTYTWTDLGLVTQH